VSRPLTSIERTAEFRRGWYIGEEQKARESRGDKGAMEFWLRMTRSQISKEVRAGRGDVLAGFALVCRLFMTAAQARATGDNRAWDGLMQYAKGVVDARPPRDPK